MLKKLVARKELARIEILEKNKVELIESVNTLKSDVAFREKENRALQETIKTLSNERVLDKHEIKILKSQKEELKREMSELRVEILELKKTKSELSEELAKKDEVIEFHIDNNQKLYDMIPKNREERRRWR